MSLPVQLLQHALELIDAPQSDVRDVYLRRAVSAAYYAVFHQITGDAVKLLAPDVPSETRHRMQRWFDHAEMKKVCGRFVPAQLNQPLLGLIGTFASSGLQTVARNFVELQDARHKADYDLSLVLTRTDARHYVDLALELFSAWEDLARSAEANIFVLSLLLWKNWERER